MTHFPSDVMGRVWALIVSVSDCCSSQCFVFFCDKCVRTMQTLTRLVLIIYANSKDSNASAHPHSITRAFVVHTRVVYDDGLDKNQTSSLE